jgi:hypothetical protein
MASDTSLLRAARAVAQVRPYWLVPLLLAAAGSCSGDAGGITAPREPLAYTRFVHAVPDTGGTDWRFIDQIESSPVAFNLSFRGFTPYQATAVGERRLRIFPSSTDIHVTSRFLIDTTVTFEPDVYYTVVHLGFARAGEAPAHKIVVLRDDFPRQNASTIAVRAVHAGSGLIDVDVVADTAGGDAAPVVVLGSGLAYSSATAYGSVVPGLLAVLITAVDDGDQLIAAGVAPQGEAAVPAANLTAIGGSRMPGSAVSALLFPRSVPGSLAPQGPAFTQPALVFLIDRHPR